jgi:hypothetical protein
MKRFVYFISALCFICSFLSAGAAGQTLLNELDINPGGTDNPCEYVEIKGTPGAVVENVHFVSFEGDIGSTPGVATAVITFGVPGPVLGSNGLLVVTGTQACGTRTFPAGTTVAQTTLLDNAGGALQNGTNSFLFISSATAITPGTDYDTNNDGTLESLPAGATVVDGVAWSDGGAGDITYGTVVLNATGGTIGACTRFPGNVAANSAAAWYAGAMTGTNDANTYSATIRTANFPADGVLTPGAPNVGTVVALNANADFNGDGKTDFAIVRDAGGLKTWWIKNNGVAGESTVQWGLSTDRLVPEDFDGDGKDDIAVWREAPATVASFYVLQSSSNTLQQVIFGQTGDRPTTVRDYDGDGKADFAVYRPGAQGTWFYRGTLNNPGNNITYIPWGTTGDVEAAGDYDGDGKGDFCIRRGGVFYLAKSTGGVEYVNWGLAGDAILPGDYDGDGKMDFTAARVNGDNFNIYILERDGGGTGGSPIIFGSDSANDDAAFGDYDGDGKQDIGIWRPNADPTQNFFWIRQSSNGAIFTVEWGQQGDHAVGEWNITGGGK